MARRRIIDPFELMLRRGNLSKLLDFFMRAEERLTMAFPRASRVLAESSSPSAKQVRGGTRRHYLHDALLSAATDAGLPVETRWTESGSWSYPIVKIGGFSLTIGIVETRYRGASRALRTKSKYMEQLCARNALLDPQTSLFEDVSPTDTVIADGSMGALIVSQYRPQTPDVPAFLGFWVPAEGLKSHYYARSFDQVIAAIRDRLSMARRPAKRTVERKPLRKRQGKPDDKKA